MDTEILLDQEVPLEDLLETEGEKKLRLKICKMSHRRARLYM